MDTGINKSRIKNVSSFHRFYLISFLIHLSILHHCIRLPARLTVISIMRRSHKFYLPFFLVLLSAFASSSLQGALRIRENAFPNRDLFGLELNENQEFYAKVASITSISLQNYNTSTFNVLELSIDLQGSPVQLRIYHTRPITKDELEAYAPEAPTSSTRIPATPGFASRIADRIADPIAGHVDNLPLLKEYPITTHAKTIEYKVSNREDLVTLYNNLRDRWIGVARGTEEDPDNQNAGPKGRLNATLFIIQ